MKLYAEDTAAIFIDFQEKLVPAIHDNETIVKRSAIFAQGLQELGVSFAVSQQYTKGLGETVPELKNVINDFSYFEKTSFSCMDCEEIAAWVKTQGKKNILVCGVEAHICVLQTICNLLDEAYNAFIVTDCVGSRKPVDMETGIERVKQEGARVTTCEAALFEMTGGAGSPHFKAISKLVK